MWVIDVLRECACRSEVVRDRVTVRRPTWTWQRAGCSSGTKLVGWSIVRLWCFARESAIRLRRCGSGSDCSGTLSN